MAAKLDDLVQAKALREQAGSFRRAGDLDGASRLYAEAVDLLRVAVEPLEFAHAARHLGEVLHERGKSVEGESLCREALGVVRATPDVDRLELANTIRSVAVVLGDRTLGGANGGVVELVEAAALWEEARVLYQSLGVQAGVDESVERMAVLKMRMGTTG